MIHLIAINIFEYDLCDFTFFQIMISTHFIYIFDIGIYILKNSCYLYFFSSRNFIYYCSRNIYSLLGSFTNRYHLMKWIENILFLFTFYLFLLFGYLIGFIIWIICIWIPFFEYFFLSVFLPLKRSFQFEFFNFLIRSKHEISNVFLIKNIFNFLIIVNCNLIS